MKAAQRSMQKDAEALLAEARTQAEALKLDHLRQAQAEADSLRLEVEKELTRREALMSEEKTKLDDHINATRDLLASVQDKQQKIQEAQLKLDGQVLQYDADLVSLHQQRSELADLSPEQARQAILSEAELRSKKECGSMLKLAMHEMNDKASESAREILLSAMQRYSAECASDRTTTTIYLPSDEIKGRIIGRDGRNIRALESLTGANVIIDDTPETVVISCFDPYRRELARVTLEKLIEDGRIHPNRIHEIVNLVKEDMDKDMERATSFLCEELNVGSVSPDISHQLGRLKYRFNSFQNLLQHSREVACLMGLIAAELGMDSRLAKRIGLLHAIGQSFDESAELNSAQAGADFLRRAGEGDIIVQAIENYRDTYTLSCGMDRLLHVAVQVSKNRPGATDEAMDSYVHRLHQIENLMRSLDQVEDCVVLQAGREVLVSVKPDKVKDNEMSPLARTIASRIESEMTLPGPVQVIISREIRVEEIAAP